MTKNQGDKLIEWQVVTIAAIIGVLLYLGICGIASKNHTAEQSRFYDRSETHMVEEERRADERLNLLYAQCEREARREGSSEPNIVCGTLGKEQRE